MVKNPLTREDISTCFPHCLRCASQVLSRLTSEGILWTKQWGQEWRSSMSKAWALSTRLVQHYTAVSLYLFRSFQFVHYFCFYRFAWTQLRMVYILTNRYSWQVGEWTEALKHTETEDLLEETRNSQLILRYLYRWLGEVCTEHRLFQEQPPVWQQKNVNLVDLNHIKYSRFGLKVRCEPW